MATCGRVPVAGLVPSDGRDRESPGGGHGVHFGSVDRETPLVVLAVVGRGVLVGQLVGADQRLGKRRRRGQMRALGHETVLGVGVVFHLVDHAVRAGVRVVPLRGLCLVLGARVLQLSGFASRDTVTGLVAAISA